HSMDKRPVLLRIIDSNIVRGGAYPNLLALKALRPEPDPQVMTLRKRIVLFLKHQIRRSSVQQQCGNWRLLIPAHFHNSPERLQLRLASERIGRKPARCLEGCIESFAASDEHQVR